jgi:hypothetical protein
MGTPTLSRSALTALLLAAIAVAACKSEDPTPPACTLAQLGEACDAPADCCSSNCQNSTCVKPAGECRPEGGGCADQADCCTGACNSVDCVVPGQGVCGELGDACDVPTDCCQANCVGNVCVKPAGQCDPDVGAPCTAKEDCCSGICTDLQCAEPATPGCVTTGPCPAGDAQCCSGECTPTGCYAPTYPTGENPGGGCLTDLDCNSMTCQAGTCVATVCRKATQSCVADSQCCSGRCGFGNECEALPPGAGSTCTTLGEACALAADCCSTNCVGATDGVAKTGTCKPAADCSATGDVCYGEDDCCSGLCEGFTATRPGRCRDAAGGCGLDGYPCSTDSGCCTRSCVDLGTGAKVCQPSPGCRLNGNYCDSTASCCNVNNLVPSSQWIACDPVDHVCDNGGSCNPPGDICGLGVNASQNCCFGKKDVCKYDSAGIPRCFGGCPETGCTEPCPTGWDANDPQCCIQPGEICQFRDQCCGSTPCVPGTDGILRCAETSTCMPQGSICSDAPAPSGSYTPAQGPCCEGTLCRYIDEIGWACAAAQPPPTGCATSGESCGGSNPPCCIGTCNAGTCGADCAPNGTACSGAAQCCSGVCDAGFCRAACLPEAGACTATSDCCAGLACEIPSGATSGTCQGESGPTCAATAQSCVVGVMPCCSASDTCEGGVCTPPPSCAETSQRCTATGNECCAGLQCSGLTVYPEEQVPCSDPSRASAECSCEAPLVCPGLNEACSALVPCCGGEAIYCSDAVGLGCTSTAAGQCTCKPIG